MPIYEYVCNTCGHEFEEWQKITDAPVQKCPSCGKRRVDRLVSLSAFHLKGSGWYVTDYGKKGSSDSSSKKSKAKASDTTEGSSSSSQAGKATEKAGSSDTSTAKASKD